MYRVYKNKSTVEDQSVTTKLINTAEPTVLISYVEFDENDNNFKIVSGSYERESDDV